MALSCPSWSTLLRQRLSTTSADSMLARWLHVLLALFRLSVKVGPSSRAQALFHILLYLLPVSGNPRPSQQSLNTGRARRSDTVDYCQSYRTKPAPPPLWWKVLAVPAAAKNRKKLKSDEKGRKKGGKLLDIAKKDDKEVKSAADGH